ncbi:MAG: F0F1 ATP synthase subunit epsilon [Terrisporobacter sp.]|uniref:FoF1 ATP synthase subunit delta/epsilon n=1 Tax=Terrisporobacter sp. TaxID=1965305 RepID=UPI002FC89159
MANIFALEIVTPQEIFYEGDVEMVITRTTHGDRAVLKDHIPFVTGLVDGELRIKKDGKFKSGQISGGFMTVNKEKTTILTESAKWNDESKGL